GSVEKLKAQTAFTPIYPQQPRSRRAVAATDVTLLKVDRERQDELLTWSQAAEHLLVDLATRRELDEDAVWLDTVLRSNLFLKVPPTNVRHILRHLQTRIVNEGEVIIRQGDVGDCCYFIKEGVAEVTRNSPNQPSATHVADISEGRCFGEDALIQETVRNANVIMKSQGVLLVLDKQEFLPLLKEPSIETCTFKQLASDSPKVILLDVRKEPEYNQGHLPEAVNLPLHLMHLKRRVLDDSQTYVTCCNTGSRARAACQFLKDLGYKAKALNDGLDHLPQVSTWSTEDFILKDGQVVSGH
uniref:cyclic nucleotide-binding domain-containing protein n=1 Tax=Pseudomaricurvus sp. TaxID=2004510 RepID=UPI003F6CAD03